MPDSKSQLKIVAAIVILLASFEEVRFLLTPTVFLRNQSFFIGCPQVHKFSRLRESCDEVRLIHFSC